MTAPPRWAADTSVSLPLLLASHEAHDIVAAWAAGREVDLCGHALSETYSVLTRLPGDARVSPGDAARLIDENFPRCLTLAEAAASTVHIELARHGIAGGAVYDGIIALTAKQHATTLVTRDARARQTYEALGVQVVIL